MENEVKKTGFAAMDPAKVREIASKGGRAAHAAGRAHRFTSEKAREAGRKGGLAPHSKRGRGQGAVTSAEHDADIATSAKLGEFP